VGLSDGDGRTEIHYQMLVFGEGGDGAITMNMPFSFCMISL
jgi:hypothetical protein